MSRHHGFYAALFSVALLAQALPNAADAAPKKSYKPVVIPNGDVAALRNAITNAASGGTIVLFNNGTYVLNGKPLTINKKITITGQGATIDGDDLSLVIDVTITGNLTLCDVIITGGFTEYDGGGIYNEGTLTLNGTSSVSGNTAGTPQIIGLAESGGGIFNNGTVTLKDKSSVSRNTADTAGGGIFNGGTLTLSGTSSVSRNEAEYDGGGICNDGTLTLNGMSSVCGNAADIYGGGICNVGTLTLNGTSSVCGNAADIGGGGIYNLWGDVTLNGCSSVSGNEAEYGGGGIFNRGEIDNDGTLTLNDISSVSGNKAESGGGIFNDGGMLTNAKPQVNVRKNDPDDIFILD